LEFGWDGAKQHLQSEEKYKILKIPIAADVLTKAYPMLQFSFYFEPQKVF
jgi:hypothetical protein